MMHNLFSEFDFVTCIEELTKGGYNLQLNIGDEGCVYWELIPAVAGSGIQSIVAGKNIAVDNSDPLNPIVSNIFDILDQYIFETADLIAQRGDVTLYEINFPSTHPFTEINLLDLISVTTKVSISGLRLTQVLFPNLQTVGGLFSETGGLVSVLDLSSLQTVGGSFDISNYKGSVIDLPLLQSVASFYIQVGGTSPALTTINAPSLLTTNGEYFQIIVTGTSNVFTGAVLSSLITTGRMTLTHTSGTAGSVFSFPSLTTINHISLPSNGHLEINATFIKEGLFPNLISVTGGVYINVNVTTDPIYFDTLDLSSLVSVGSDFRIGKTSGSSYSPLLTSIDISSLTTVPGQFIISRMIGLTTIILSNSLNATNIDLRNNALSQASVDDILNKIDIAGYNNGTLRLQGGTNSTPSATGLVSKTNLQGRGRTVTNN